MGGTTEVKVLVVDDNLDFLDLMDALLSQEGYTCVRCPRAVDALPLATQTRPAAIISDLLMPGTSGWEAIAALKSDPCTCGIPIIICTAAAHELARPAELVGRYGCAALLKPFDLEAILEKLAIAVAGREVKWQPVLC